MKRTRRRRLKKIKNDKEDDVKSIHGYIKDLIADSPESKKSQTKSCKHSFNKF
jgi:hypothetical protein